MSTIRKIQIVTKQVSYEEAKKNDMVYISRLSEDELLKEAFDLRKLNYFGGKEYNLPRIEIVKNTFNRN